MLNFAFIINQTSKNRRRHSRKTEPESEESDSDQDQLTSSRTESSNQLDAKLKHSKNTYNLSDGYPIQLMRNISVGLIYHGTQSSTSSDLSPMSEQKSLPRRGRSRYHHHHYTTNTTPRHKPAPQSSQTSLVNNNNNTNPIITASTTNNLLNSTNTSPRSCKNTRMQSQFRPIYNNNRITTTNISNATTARLSPSC